MAGLSWRAIDFISDLHLQASEPATFQAWQSYMQTTPADALFILGDLFEVWVGDDVLKEDGFEHRFSKQQLACRCFLCQVTATVWLAAA